MFINIAKIILLCGAFAFAEQLSQENSFNTLRGFAYNPYGTLGAAPSIADILQKPSDIYGHKFVYVSPESGSGYSAFDLAGGSALLSFDQSLMLGYAKSFYGLLLSVSPYKFCNRIYDDSYECSSKSKISLDFSVPLGSSVIYAHTGKANTGGYYEEDGDGDIVSYKRELSVSEVYIGITGGNRLVWDLRFDFDRYKNSFSGYGYKSDFTPYEFDFADYLTDLEFLFNFGYKVLQSDRLKFIVGLNNQFSYQYYSYDYDHVSRYYLLATVSPNFLGEFALTKHLLAFVGASYSLSSYVLLYSDDTKIETFSIDNDEPGAYAGLRYEYKNLAVETRLQSDVFGELFGGNNPFIALGVFFFFR